MNDTIMTTEETEAMKERARVEDPKLYKLFCLLKQLDRQQPDAIQSHFEKHLRMASTKPSRNFVKLRELGRKVESASGNMDILASDLWHIYHGTNTEEAVYEGFLAGLGLGAQIQKRKEVL